MTVVVDASLIVAVLVADDRQDVAWKHLAAWVAADEELHAPAVLPYEITDVLARLVFDRSLELADVDDLWTDLAALGIILHPFDLIGDGPEIAAVTARLRKRHATDSAYVCLAQRLGTVMWTLDAALARNATDVGLPVQLVR